MNKVQAVIADSRQARANVEKFGKAIKAALEELHSDEVTRQNSLARFQDGVSEATESITEIVQKVFDPISNAYDQIQLIAAVLGVEMDDAEF